MLKLLIILYCIAFSGCVTTPHKNIYVAKLQEIETAYQDKKITYAEYLQLKNNVQIAREQRKATILSAYLTKQQQF